MASMSGNRDSIDYKIKLDHRRIFAWYDKYKSLETNSPDRKKWANQLIWEISCHSMAEELVLYPQLENHLPEGSKLADENRHEHLEVKEGLNALDNAKIDSGFDEKLREVMNNLTEHIKKEEADELPSLCQKLSTDELLKLGSRYDSTKKMVPTRPHPSAPDKPASLEAVVGMSTAPLDKLRDKLRTFPTEAELQELIGE